MSLDNNNNNNNYNNTALCETDPTTFKQQSAQSGHWHIEETDDLIFISNTGTDCSNIQPEPADTWRKRLAGYLNTLAGVAVVGAKRITSDNNIFSMGEFVIHPKGFHHLGHGWNAIAYRFPEEVDVIAGGVFVILKKIYYQVGGINVKLGDLAGIDLCLKIRLAGSHRCIVVPDVIVENTSSPTPTFEQTKLFRDQWGFDWHIADLDIVKENYAGTPGFMWNVRFWGRSMPFEKYISRPAVHWTNYNSVEQFRKRADHLAKVICNLTPSSGIAADVGCGDGLYAHLAALQGVLVKGFDNESLAINQAREKTRAVTNYPNNIRPEFTIARADAIPLPNESCQTVYLLDVIEHLPNPVTALREAVRVLAKGGHLFISTPEAQFGTSSDPVYHVCEYTHIELSQQINAIPGLSVINIGKIGGIYRDLLLIAEKSVTQI